MEIPAIAATQSQPEEVPDTWRPLKCQLIREHQKRSLIPALEGAEAPWLHPPTCQVSLVPILCLTLHSWRQPSAPFWERLSAPDMAGPQTVPRRIIPQPHGLAFARVSSIQLSLSAPPLCLPFAQLPWGRQAGKKPEPGP